MPRSAFHRSLEMQVALQHLQTLMLFVFTQDWMLIIQLDPGSIQCFFFFPLNSANVTACDWICSLILIFPEDVFQMFFSALPPTLSSLFKRVFKLSNSLIQTRSYWCFEGWRCEGAAQRVGSPRAADKGCNRVWGEAAGCAWATSFLGEQWDRKNSFGQVK